MALIRVAAALACVVSGVASAPMADANYDSSKGCCKSGFQCCAEYKEQCTTKNFIDNACFRGCLPPSVKVGNNCFLGLDVCCSDICALTKCDQVCQKNVYKRCPVTPAATNFPTKKPSAPPTFDSNVKELDESMPQVKVANKYMDYEEAFFGVDISAMDPPWLSASLVLANPIYACSKLKAKKNPSIEGKIVVVKRGECSFLEKAESVGKAGGAAMIVINVDSKEPVSMVAPNGMDPTGVTIPVVSIGMLDGDYIEGAIKEGKISGNEVTGGIGLEAIFWLGKYFYTFGIALDFGPSLLQLTPALLEVPVTMADPRNACENDLKNGPEIEGHILVIERGHCWFFDKILLAQNHGAKGVVIIDTENELPTNMIKPSSGHDSDAITIPSVTLGSADGAWVEGYISSNSDRIVIGKMGTMTDFAHHQTHHPTTYAPSTKPPTDAGTTGKPSALPQVPCPKDFESLTLCHSIPATRCHWKSSGASRLCTKCDDGTCRAGKDVRVCEYGEEIYRDCTAAPTASPSKRPTRTPTSPTAKTKFPTPAPSSVVPTTLPSESPTSIPNVPCPKDFKSLTLCPTIPGPKCHWKSNGGNRYCIRCGDDCLPGKDERVCEFGEGIFRDCTAAPTALPTSRSPTTFPTERPTPVIGTSKPTAAPSPAPTSLPTFAPSDSPTNRKKCPDQASLKRCSSQGKLNCMYSKNRIGLDCTWCGRRCLPGPENIVCQYPDLYDHCTFVPTNAPTTKSPTVFPTATPSTSPTTHSPHTPLPTSAPSRSPTPNPTLDPTASPTTYAPNAAIDVSGGGGPNLATTSPTASGSKDSGGGAGLLVAVGAGCMLFGMAAILFVRRRSNKRTGGNAHVTDPQNHYGVGGAESVEMATPVNPAMVAMEFDPAAYKASVADLKDSLESVPAPQHEYPVTRLDRPASFRGSHGTIAIS